MIKIDIATNTRDSKGASALPVPTGILLNITPYFQDRVEMIETEPESEVFIPTTIYSIAFEAKTYKDMAAYDAQDEFINSDMFEYPITHVIDNVDPQSWTSIDDVFNMYRTVIEDGIVGDDPSNTYSGVGAGNTSLIYPTV